MQILLGLGVVVSASYSPFLSQHFHGEQKEIVAGLTIAAIIAVLFGLIIIWVAVALWRLRTWAWFLMLLIALLTVADNVYAGINSGWQQSNIIPCIVHGLMCLYLLSVYKYFGKP